MAARVIAGALAGVALAGLIGAAVVGCGAPAVSPSASASSSPLVSPVTGVLVHIDAAGLADVRAFTLRLADGTEAVFRIGILENGAQFPPGHLAEHMASTSPVRAFFRLEGVDRVVYRIEDAP